MAASHLQVLGVCFVLLLAVVPSATQAAAAPFPSASAASSPPPMSERDARVITSRMLKSRRPKSRGMSVRCARVSEIEFDCVGWWREGARRYRGIVNLKAESADTASVAVKIERRG